MGVKRHNKADAGFEASDNVVKSLESITGFLAHAKAEYGSAAEMAERADWDSARNGYVLSLLKGLKKEIARFTTEFKDHVESQTGRR
jgi:hypothetical protein